MKTKLMTLMLIVLSLCPTVLAQEADTTVRYTTWLNQMIQEVLHKPIDLRDSGKQSETPALGETSTTLVDRSSAPSLVGLALNLAGVPTGSDNGTDSSVTTTMSLYALYAGIRSIDPLDPAFYARHAALRRVSLTAGYDEEEESGSGDQRTQIFGVKGLIWDRRQVSANSDSLVKIQNALLVATGEFGRLDQEIRSFVVQQEKVRAQVDRLLQAKEKTPAEAKELAAADMETFAQRDPELFTEIQQEIFSRDFATTLQNLGEEGAAEVARMIESHIDPFAKLDRQTQEAIATIQGRPQLSFSTITRHRPEGADDYAGELIYDQRIGKRAILTLNGSYEYRDNDGAEQDNKAERVAAQFEMPMGPSERLAGRNPTKLSISVENRWKTDEKDAFRAQAKLSFPVMDGVDFPISLTFSNREELIDEEDVRGNFGFTLDIARLVDGLRARAGNGGGT